jgi:hypothetical protein
MIAPLVAGLTLNLKSIPPPSTGQLPKLTLYRGMRFCYVNSKLNDTRLLAVPIALIGQVVTFSWLIRRTSIN